MPGGLMIVTLMWPWPNGEYADPVERIIVWDVWLDDFLPEVCDSTVSNGAFVDVLVSY